MNNTGGGSRKTVPRYLFIIVITVVFLTPGPRGAALAGGDTYLHIAAPIIGVIGTAAIAYGMWINRPSQQGQGKTIPGEFYVGLFSGASLLEKADWSYGGLTNALNVYCTPAVLGGLKFGYFCPFFPWVGLEAETSFARHDVDDQTVGANPPVNGATHVRVPLDKLKVWTMALKLMGRYGFLPDSEVPFGRLQPYVGIGPGFVVVYGNADSAKNFSLELQAGVRYMMLKNVSAFVEYKFSKQWDIELEEESLIAGGVTYRRTATLDFDNHKIAVGVAYHF
jgi:opacity protein-like surface antigen